MNELSNILLTILTSIVTGFTVYMIRKSESFSRKLEQILMKDVEQQVDIKNIKEDVSEHNIKIDNHETRITKLESK